MQGPQHTAASHSISQSVSLEIARPVAPLSFPLRGILSPWFINSACALFPTAALLQSKEVGLLSIQIFSFVSMFSGHGRVRLVYVCVSRGVHGVGCSVTVCVIYP